MLGVEDVAIVVGERVVKLAVCEQLLFQPDRPRFEQRSKTPGRNGKVRLEDALELEQWLIVEADVRQVTGRDSCRAQAILDRTCRKIRVALDAREAFLLRRGNDRTVAKEARRAVVVKGRQAEDERRSHADK